MSKLEQRVLTYDVQQAEKQLSKIAKTHDKTSAEYQTALKRFIRLWSVLRMTRSQDEFFHEVSSLPAQQ